MRTRFFAPYLVAAMGVTLLATSFSSDAAATTKPKAIVRPSTNRGLCKLVAPSVVATAVSTSMGFPVTLTHGSETQCTYRSKTGTNAAVLIRYDTDASEKSFAASEKTFARHNLKLTPIQGLGDKAYYFSLSAGESTTVTTVVVVKGSVQILTTGTGTIDDIGAVARYALNTFESSHPHP